MSSINYRNEEVFTVTERFQRFQINNVDLTVYFQLHLLEPNVRVILISFHSSIHITISFCGTQIHNQKKLKRKSYTAALSNIIDLISDI